MCAWQSQLPGGGSGTGGRTALTHSGYLLRQASDQRKSSSDTSFHFGICRSVSSGVKKCARNLPSAGFSPGTLDGTPGCAVM